MWQQHFARQEELENKLKAQNEDWHGAANEMLEVLLRHGLDGTPDEEVVDHLNQMVTAGLARQFLIPRGVKYPRPLRDKYIPFEARDTWEGDYLPQFIISAYMFGATMERLPEPHRWRFRFYKMLAHEQAIAIYQAVVAWYHQNKQKSPGNIPWHSRDEYLSEDTIKEYQPMLEQLDAYEEWRQLLENAKRRLQHHENRLPRAVALHMEELEEQKQWQKQQESLRQQQERKQREQEQQQMYAEKKKQRQWEQDQSERQQQQAKAELDAQIAKLRFDCEDRGMSEEEIRSHVDELIKEFYKARGAAK